MNANEILKKHEDANEMHFHEVDREWIIEAMEEYAALRQPVLAVRCYPTDDEIIKMVDDFTKDLNVSNTTKRATQFGYQEGLYKMIEIWKQSNNDR